MSTRRGGGGPIAAHSNVATLAPPTRRERRRQERIEGASAGSPRRSSSKAGGWRSPIALVTGIAVVAGLVVVLALGQEPAPAPTPSALNVPSTSYDPGLVSGEQLGRADAPVTLEIWSDFQCPFCGRLARTYLPQLVSEFVTDGSVRIIPRDVAFVGTGDPDESVESAVGASCAADQGKYWQFHDMLLWNQVGENAGAFSEARLGQMADQVGLDRGRWDTCRADPARARAVATTTSEALAAGINGTPTLVLNGVATAGIPRTYEDLADAVRAVLATAQTTR